MGKYKKKPVIIDAEQWTGSRESWERIMDMGLKDWEPGEIGTGTFIINTLEGAHLARQNDWVIKGIKGEFYPCKPDIFEKTYEPVDQEEKESEQ